MRVTPFLARLRQALGPYSGSLSVTLALSLASVGMVNAELPAPTSEETVAKRLSLYFDGREPAAAIAYLHEQASKRPLSLEENFKLAAALFAVKDFSGSLALARLLVGPASTPSLRVRAKILVIHNLCCLDRFAEAARAATEAQALDRNSTYLAGLRIACCGKANDILGRSIAEDHLALIDPAVRQTPVVFGVDDTVLAVAVITLGITAIHMWAPKDNVEAFDAMILEVIPILFKTAFVR